MRTVTNPSPIDFCLTQISYAIARLEFMSLTFQDVSAGPQILDVHPLVQTPEYGFDSIVEAHAALTDLGRLVMIAAHPNENDLSRREILDHIAMGKIQLQLSRWRQMFEELLLRNSDAAPALPVAMLRLFHTNATATLAAGSFGPGPEMRWDRQHERFLEGVCLAEAIVTDLCSADGQSSFSVEMGCTSLPRFHFWVAC